jgi:hypothetical protein
MNMPSDEELRALWEQGGFDAIAKHAEATAAAVYRQMLRDAFLNAPRKGDGKPACPACGNHLEVELKEHVKDCLFWQVDGRSLSDYPDL